MYLAELLLPSTEVTLPTPSYQKHPQSSNLSFVPPVIVVLRMFNSLDSSALFFTDSDKVTINSFVSADS